MLDMDHSQFTQTPRDMRFVIGLYQCRVRADEVVRMFESLYAPWDFEVLDLEMKVAQPIMPTRNFDRWGERQVHCLQKLWPNARTCFVMTTTYCSNPTTGRTGSVEIVGGGVDTYYKSRTMSPKALATAMTGRKVKLPNVLAEVAEELPLFVKEFIVEARKRHYAAVAAMAQGLTKA